MGQSLEGKVILVLRGFFFVFVFLMGGITACFMQMNDPVEREKPMKQKRVDR